VADTLRFVLLVVGICIVLASVSGFVVTVQKATNCRFTGVQDRPNGGFVTYYRELTPAGRDLFLRLVNHPGRAYRDPNCPSGLVRFGGQYYRVHEWGTIVWSHPPTVGAILAGLFGAACCYAAIRPDLRAAG